jgi:CBS domain containing-hemolysin-like protein
VGVISRRELFLGQRALSLGQVPIRNLMLPRDAIRTIDVAADRAEVLRQVGEHRRSRYPVVRSSLDDVVGLIDVKRLLLGAPGEDWQTAIVPIVYLPDSTTAGRAIEVLGAASDQLVLVTDEYGNVAGMLGLVDVLEFLAGPLPDERDDRDREPRRIGADRYLVPGLYRIERAREAPLKLPVDDTDVETIGGLMGERLQRVPRVGDQVRIGDRTIRVVEMVERRVHLVEVTLTLDEQGGGH